ncbi:MAG: succinate dehydrogenase cytochrome b subunit [Acidobacteria bacterium]|nr:succinate dehydrogenase cytochrome b subunit [Acidobacteriota bacterium]
MSSAATAVASPSSVETGFFDSAIGKKVVMAITGCFLFVFVIGHMIGNLQIYQGAEKINAYAHMLKSIPALLWGMRIALLVSVILHLTMAIQLTLLKRKARPVAYVKKQSIASSYASRTMIWSGPILGAFIVYHLLHFTTGQAHPEFSETDVYRNVIVGFRNVPAAGFYIVAMLMLGMHLFHGVWSMFQSLGINHPRYTPWFKLFAAVASYGLMAGNISIPVSVMLGILN